MCEQQKYVCVNCGQPLAVLYKKFTNSVKTVQCVKCNMTADKYIEFEPVIELIDAILLSQHSFRHMLFNGDFKIHWKLSVILLFLESYALWNKRSAELYGSSYDSSVQEEGFCLCCLQNLIVYYLVAVLLFVASVVLHSGDPNAIRRKYGGLIQLKVAMLKMMAIANFSKVFLIPVMIWRRNITDIGADLHYDLVILHHLIALVLAYAVVSGCNKFKAAVVVLPLYALKEILIYYTTPLFKQLLLGGS